MATPPPQPLQTALHRRGLWHGDTNVYDQHRARQLRDHAAAGGHVAAHALGDILTGGERGARHRLQGLPPRDAMRPPCTTLLAAEGITPTQPDSLPSPIVVSSGASPATA
eukprot:14257480-Alexandrium_andersonii.AAC.1